MKQPQVFQLAAEKWAEKSLEEKLAFEQENHIRMEDERLMKKIKKLQPLHLYKLHIKLEMPQIKQ